MPAPFRRFIAHYVDYRDIISRWEKGDTAVLFSAVPYPKLELSHHVEEAFDGLKKEQNSLLGFANVLAKKLPANVASVQPIAPGDASGWE